MRRAPPRGGAFLFRAKIPPVGHQTIAKLGEIRDEELHRAPGTHGPTRQFLLYAALRREQRAAMVAETSAGTETVRILTLAQSAFRELEALLAGRPTRLLDDVRDGEWTLRDLLRHAIATELRYREQVRYSATRADSETIAIPPERLPCDRLDPPDPTFADSRRGDLARTLGLLARAREETDSALAGLDDALLGRPSLWGEARIDVRERLHQIAAHLVEVTLQAEKMIRAAGESDGEARQIARRIWSWRGRHERLSRPELLVALDEELAAICLA